jgi:phosphatidylinositol-3,4,5-trisphosphate 3-phosphatase/dual-specificity protein phosphatase PTEN
MSDWLAQHPQNVCAIHCLAGKGRTGTVICSYLLHDKQAETPEQALQFFSRQRYSKISPNKPVGVEVPSQVRAVHYYGKLLSGSMPVDALSAPRKLLLKRVIMYPVPLLGVMKEGCQPLIEVYQNGQQPGAKPLYTTPVTTFVSFVFPLFYLP